MAKHITPETPMMYPCTACGGRGPHSGDGHTYTTAPKQSLHLSSATSLTTSVKEIQLQADILIAVQDSPTGLTLTQLVEFFNSSGEPLMTREQIYKECRNLADDLYVVLCAGAVMGGTDNERDVLIKQAPLQDTGLRNEE